MSARHALFLFVLLIGLAACRSSHFEAPDMQGPAAMVDDAGKPRLWLLSKQEEVRQVSVGGGRRGASWRSDTFFHFNVQAIDPATARPLWKHTIVTYGDPKAAGTQPSRIIGSAVSARLLGQEGALVWLLVGDAPYALSVADGSVVVDAERLQQANPALKGLLPSDATLYGFDNGLVFMSADARRFVVRGPEHRAVEYTPPPPPAQPEGQLLSNGRHELVPMRPFGEEPTRQTTLGGQWLGLYSDKEAADIADDEYGKSLRYPYSVLDEGGTARRRFWRARIAEVKHFDDRYERLAELTPIEAAPTFLKGRFANGAGRQALQLDNPKGVLVWHSTRMDSAGRLALARLDSSLKVLWDTPLPLSESDLIRRVPTWVVPGHVVAVGELLTQDETGVMHRDEYLVSVELATGKLVSRQLDALD
jgi:hypothetical protein